jgi:hypothetical protein
MARRLFTLLSALSLLLCVATAALWVRSYFVSDSYLCLMSESDEKQIVIVQQYAFAARGGVFFRRVRSVVTRISDPLGETVGSTNGQWPSPTQSSWVDWSRSPSTEYSGNFFKDVHPATRLWLGYGWFSKFDPEGVLGREDYLAVHLHYWLLTLLMSLLPIRLALRSWRRRRMSIGLCPQCGYDLRATPGRCPECGTAAAGKAVAAPAGGGDAA